MKHTEFCEACRTLKLTVRGLAEILNVSPTSISRWRTNKHDVPGPVAAYLRLRLQVHGFCAEVATV